MNDANYFRTTAEQLMRVIAAVSAVWLAILTPAVAQEAVGDAQKARADLQNIAHTMVQSLQDPAVRASVPRLQRLVVDVLVPHIDFRVSSNLVLGPHWNDANEAQREAFMKEFQSFLVRFYTGALASYVDSSDIPVDVMSFPDAVVVKGKNQAVVRSRVGQADGEPVEVDYRMYWSGGWKVVDVSVSGISMVQNYRSNFTSTVQKHGLDTLIAQLQERNRTFAAN